MAHLLPKQMRYRAALLPDRRDALGFLPLRGKRKGSFAASGGRTRQEQATGVPE
jgi:hypothetical protein